MTWTGDLATTGSRADARRMMELKRIFKQRPERVASGAEHGTGSYR
jgi:hypothetical protein